MPNIVWNQQNKPPVLDMLERSPDPRESVERDCHGQTGDTVSPFDLGSGTHIHKRFLYTVAIHGNVWYPVYK